MAMQMRVRTRRARMAARQSLSMTLFPCPSFLDGIARIFDFAGALNVYNVEATPQEADRKALASDWRAIGEDMFAAMQQFASQQNNPRSA